MIPDGSWPPGRFTVTVKDGIVTLEGKPDDRPLGREIIARARRVQGVVSVRDRLSYPLPEQPANPGHFF